MISSARKKYVTTNSKYLSNLKGIVQKKIIDVENTNVEEFRDAREKFLQQRRQEDEKLIKTKEEQAKRNAAPPVPGRIFKMNRGGSSLQNDRLKN